MTDSGKSFVSSSELLLFFFLEDKSSLRDTEGQIESSKLK